MKNKYSLNAESYGISKLKWREIRDTVSAFEVDSKEAVKRFKLDEVEGCKIIDDSLCKKRVWFLYDVLLQEKYNHLYKREKLTNPKVGDYVYCDFEGFGRGTIEKIFKQESLMLIKFDKIELSVMCSGVDMTTLHDEIKRKITRL